MISHAFCDPKCSIISTVGFHCTIRIEGLSLVIIRASFRPISFVPCFTFEIALLEVLRTGTSTDIFWCIESDKLKTEVEISAPKNKYRTVYFTKISITYSISLIEKILAENLSSS